jgi:hypothetical protein
MTTRRLASRKPWLRRRHRQRRFTNTNIHVLIKKTRNKTHAYRHRDTHMQILHLLFDFLKLRSPFVILLVRHSLYCFHTGEAFPSYFLLLVTILWPSLLFFDRMPALIVYAFVCPLCLSLSYFAPPCLSLPLLVFFASFGGLSPLPR